MSSSAPRTIEGPSSVASAEAEAEESNFDRLARFLRDDSWRKNMCSMLSNNNDDDDEEEENDNGNQGNGGSIMSPLQFVLSIGSNLKTVREVYQSKPEDLNVSTFYVACENIASPGVLSFLLEKQPNLIQEAHEQDLSLVDAILFGYPEPEVTGDGETTAASTTDPQETRRREDNIRVLVKAWPSVLLTTYRAYAETTLERCLINKRCTNDLKQFLVSMFPAAQQEDAPGSSRQEFILHNGPEMDLQWLSQILPKIQSFKSYSDQWDEDQQQQPQPHEEEQQQPQQQDSSTSFQDLLKLVLLENQHLEQVHLHLPTTASISRRSSSSSSCSSASSCVVGSSGEDSTTRYCNEDEAGRSRKRRRVSLDGNSSHHHHHRRRGLESTLLSVLKDSLTTGKGSSKLSKLVLVGVPQRDVVTYQETILKALQEKNTILESLELYCGQWSSPQNQYGDCYFPKARPSPAAAIVASSSLGEDDDEADYDSDMEQDLLDLQQQAAGTSSSTSVTTPSVASKLQHYLMLNQFGRAKVKNAQTTMNDFLDLLGKVREYQSSTATTTSASAVVRPGSSSSSSAAAATATSIMSVEYDLLQEMLGSHPGLLPSLLASINSTTNT